MARNVEIKARARDARRLRGSIETLPVSSREVLLQEDTFFRAGPGRLKLRRFDADLGQLIRYGRADEKGPKVSSYSILETNHPDAVLRSLSNRYEIQGIVRKSREVYIVGQTRIHLDKVEGLGSFVEFEYVLDEGQDAEEGKEFIKALMARLGIGEEDLVEGAYIDLLTFEAFESL